MSKGKSRVGDENQTQCWIGPVWMEAYFDTLPAAVRQRLRSSAFNLCPACLVTWFTPEVKAKHSEFSRQRALFAAIEVMESELRKERGDA
jgi:hypothetical protein